MAVVSGAVICLLMVSPLAALQCGPHQYETAHRCCSVCPADGRVVSACTAQSDTSCECPAGRWLDLAAGRCRVCTRCLAGTGPSRPCSPHHDSVCGACPPGTFSHEAENGAGSLCQRCSACADDQVKIQNCTARQDTICMDESFHRLSEGGHGPALSPAAGELPQPQPTHGASSDIPIYCGILGTLIFVLILYVAIRHWKLRAAPQKSPTPPIPSSVVVSRPSQLSADPSCPQIEPLFSVPLRKRLSEMPVNERREVETQLCNHPTNNWSALAAVLGYTKEQTRQIQQLAVQKKTNPARLLISDWSKRSDATVTSFVQALSMAGRRDLAGLVSPKPVRLTVANVDNFV